MKCFLSSDEFPSWMAFFFKLFQGPCRFLVGVDKRAEVTLRLVDYARACRVWYYLPQDTDTGVRLRTCVRFVVYRAYRCISRTALFLRVLSRNIAHAGNVAAVSKLNLPAPRGNACATANLVVPCIPSHARLVSRASLLPHLWGHWNYERDMPSCLLTLMSSNTSACVWDTRTGGLVFL